MKRKFSCFAALCIATVAFAGISVAPASAAAAKFAAEKYPVKVSGTNTNNHVFTANAGTITCKKATFSGLTEPAGAVETLDISAKYEECEFLGVKVTVSMGACHYLFHAGEKTAEGSTGSVDVVNNTGSTKCKVGEEPISFEALGCKVEVAAQTGLKSIKYTNKAGPPKFVQVAPSVEKIAYTQSALCVGGKGSFANGTYKGEAKVTGTSGGKETGVFIE
jgi:hypothetical protein